MIAIASFPRMLAAATLAAMCLQGASASEFLRSRTPGEALQPVMQAAIESTLLAELSVDSARLRSLEQELKPMYAALPKSEHGTLEPAAVRYALHRYFVAKHGWYIKGLEPGGQSWNTSAPSSVMQSRVPNFIQSRFEEHLHGRGMELHDLAVFAATLLDFVHNEALSDVMDLYKNFGLPTAQPAPQWDVEKVINAYVLQLLDMNNPITTLSEMHETDIYLTDEFPGFGDFKVWVDDLRKTMLAQQARSGFQVQKYSLEHVVELTQALNDQLGAFQNLECHRLKAGLMDIEYKKTGRVLLSDFYRVGLSGNFLFNEHADFLRKLGALDEHDPNHPSLIIANYLASQANCLASTSFHSVCCIDECQDLMSHLEHAVAAPMARPGRIAEVVAGLHSDTIDAPRNLSASLIARLEDIADHHDGTVPLHGRLFAQWMHHAYPLECPFPHATGTLSPVTADEWMNEAGKDQVAMTNGDLGQYMNKDKSVDEKAEALPWMHLEELVVSHKSAPGAQAGRKVVRVLAGLVALGVWIWPMSRARSFFSLKGLVGGVQLDKQHMV